MEWKTVLDINDVVKLVGFDKQCHIPRDCLTVEDYLGWIDLGLVINYVTDDELEIPV